jgi:hypothetical protein
MRTASLKLSLLGLLAAACSSAGTTPTGTSSSALSGPIDLRVADADDDDIGVTPPADTAAQVVVTVDRIDARFEDGRPDDDDRAWTTVSTTTSTVDLLTLKGGTFASLGVTQLLATVGELEALRLSVSATGPSYVVTGDGLLHTLNVPSGAIRVTGDFDVAACASGHVTLAFAGKRSIAFEDSTGTWNLRPVIRVKEVVAAGACPDDDTAGREGQDRDRNAQ